MFRALAGVGRVCQRQKVKLGAAGDRNVFHRRLLCEPLEDRRLLSVGIGGRVWSDLNQDGVRADNERGVAGAVVEVYASTNTTIGDTDDVSRGIAITDADGNYSFSGVPTSAYYYEVFRTPVGYTFTTKDTGSDDTKDSDVGSAGNTSLFTVSAGGSDSARDAGLRGAAPAFGFALWINSQSSNGGSTLATDAAGDIYVAGDFCSMGDFDAGPGNYSLSGGGGASVFVAKYTPAGALVWARRIGGAGVNDCAYAGDLVVGSDGSTYIAGSFCGTADFDPGAGISCLVSPANFDYDGYLLKLDPAGNFVWVRQLGANGQDSCAQIVPLPDGNLAVTGSFTNTVDFDHGPGTCNLTGGGSFIWKVTTDAGFLWAIKTAGNMGGIAVGTDGSIYATGRFYQYAINDFDPGTGTASLPNAGMWDAYVLKLDFAGGFLWACDIGGTGNEAGRELQIAPDGGLVIAGEFGGTVDFDPGTGVANLTSIGSTDLFVVKLSSIGDYAWARSMPKTDYIGMRTWVAAIDGGIYLTGGFCGTVDFDMGQGTFNMTSAGGSDVFVTELDSAGDFVFAQRVGGTGDDECRAIAVAPDGSIYTTGIHTGTGDFDPSGNIFTITGSYSPFLAKFLRDHAPADLALASSAVAENQTAGTAVGSFSSTDPDYGEAFTYSLVSGAGDDDNGAFTINSSGQLLTATTFDYETKTSYSIRVRTTDYSGMWYEKAFAIAVADVDEPPAVDNLTPTPSAVTKGQIINLSATANDPDIEDSISVVRFYEGSTLLSNGTLSGGQWTYSWNTTGHATGTFTISAIAYDSDSTPSAVKTASVTVNPVQTTTTLAAGASESVYGQSVTFTATVSPDILGLGLPTGTVTFMNGTTVLGTGTLSGGVATYTTSLLSIGSHSITAVYAGDASFTASTSQTVSVETEDPLMERRIVLASMQQTTEAGQWTSSGTGTIQWATDNPFFGDSYLRVKPSPDGTLLTVTFTPSAAMAANGGLILALRCEGNSGDFTNQQNIRIYPSTSSSDNYRTGVKLGQTDWYGTWLDGTWRLGCFGAGSGDCDDGRGWYSTRTDTLPFWGSAASPSLPIGELVFEITADPGKSPILDIGLVATNKTSYSVPMVITFDDNYATPVTNGLPILSQYGMTGVIAVNMGNVGKTDTEWDVGAPYATVPQLLTAQQSGWDVISHGSPNHESLWSTNTKSEADTYSLLQTNLDLMRQAGLNGTSYAIWPGGGLDTTNHLGAQIADSLGIEFRLGAGESGDGFYSLTEHTYAWGSCGGDAFRPQFFGPRLSVGNLASLDTVWSGKGESGYALTMRDMLDRMVRFGMPIVLHMYNIDPSATHPSEIKSSLLTEICQWYSANHAAGTVFNCGMAGLEKWVQEGGVALANQQSTTTALGAASNPSVYGQSVTFTATVSPDGSGIGTPTGIVTFRDGTTSLGTRTLSGGIASLTISTLGAGSHAITATYGGDAGFTDSSSAFLGQTVEVPDLTVIKSHSGEFRQGDTGDTYTIVVSNVGDGPTGGTVSLVDSLPAGLTATAFGGLGWTVDLSTLTATRSDVLAAGASYPALTLTVNVSVGTAASVTNTAMVSGGGELNTENDTADDVTTVVNTPPTALVGTPSSPQSGNVTISYSLTDVQSDICSVVVEYSPDGGTTWKTATAGSGGDGTTGLTSSASGQSHTFVWASGSDIVRANNANVRLRIVPSDAAVGLAGTSGVFAVNNDREPTDILLSNASVAENQSAVTTVGTLSTSDPDVGDTFTYSLVAGTGGADNDLFAIDGNVLKTAATFDYEARTGYSVRIRSTDQGGMYTEKVFAIEVVDVNESPSAAVTTPSGPQSGNVTIDYSLVDAECDVCSVMVECSLDGGATWKAATPGKGGDGTTGFASSPTGQSHTFVWASDKDVVNANNATVMVRITPSDAAAGTAGTSGVFTVNNASGSITTTIGLFQPVTSKFFLRYTNNAGYADKAVNAKLSANGWIPLAGDWTGYGWDYVGLYDPNSSTFHLRRPDGTDLAFVYGPAGAGWLPLAGDWNGDGIDTVGLYDPSASKFYLRNENSTGYASKAFSYGPAGAGWTPITGDWTAGDTDTIGLYDPAASRFYLRNTNNAGFADRAFSYGPSGAGWTPITGDWTGTGKDRIGLYNPTTSQFYLRNTNSTGYADKVFMYGMGSAGWLPVIGHWNQALLVDGDVKLAPAGGSVLGQAELRPIVAEAIARWSASGLDAAGLAKLGQVQFSIGDLPGGLLGEAEVDRVFIDADAAGYGWFVDATPGRDEEYSTGSVDPRAVDRIDLLTVVEHELGHVLGLGDVERAADELMSGWLRPGMRRQPSGC
jgi:hypothetical protein